MHIEVKDIILQIVNFSILLFVLTRFLYRPLLKIMEARSKKIQEGLEAAEKSLEERALAEAEKKKLLNQAEKEAAGLLDQARQEAKETNREIVATARQEAREAVDKEYLILESKIAEEEQKARQKIADLVTKTTEAVLQGSLNQKNHRQLIKDQIKNLSTKN